MKRRVSPHPLSASSYEDLFRDRRARPVSQFEARLLSGVCRSVERLKNLMASNSWICADSKWIELHYKNVSFSMESTLEHRRIPRHDFQRISSSESTLHSPLFSLCFTAVTRQKKKTFAPTNFKTCWSRCYSNQLHWFFAQAAEKMCAFFTQALQKLVFTPTIPCSQTSFCTI